MSGHSPIQRAGQRSCHDVIDRAGPVWGEARWGFAEDG
jgi:hypothetical protein